MNASAFRLITASCVLACQAMTQEGEGDWRRRAEATLGEPGVRQLERDRFLITSRGALGGSEINAAKITLANEVTTLCHGAEAAATAEATAREVFERGGLGEDLPTLSLGQGDVPEAGISIVQLLVKSGLAGSGKEAKRLIAEGGARLDDMPVSDAGLFLGLGDLTEPRKLSAGRKRHALVRLEV